MVSYAPKGGSVGPHVDNYDVFLLQVIYLPLHQQGAAGGIDLLLSGWTKFGIARVQETYISYMYMPVTMFFSSVGTYVAPSLTTM